MIFFNQVVKNYMNNCVLDHLNFYLAENDIAFLIGKSGSGKSTLLRLIAAIDGFDTGELKVFNYDLSKIKRQSIPYFRRKIGLIFQDHNLLERRTVFDNLALPLVCQDFTKKEIHMRVKSMLELINLSGSESYLVSEMSGGEQQRIGIARAVIHRPLLILADEPTGNLDPTLSLEIMKLFDILNQLGTTILIVTHDLTLVATQKFRTFILSNGKINE